MSDCQNNAENLKTENDDNSDQSILNALLDVGRDHFMHVNEEEEEMGEAGEEEDGMSICNGVKRRKALRKAPDAPKRFKSAYIYFIMDKMEEVRSTAGESLKVTDMMKQLAIMWNSLPAEYKKHYEEIACTDKERWLNDLAHYTGPMQVPNRRQKKPPGAPKRAISAFLSFSQQMRPILRDIHPGLKNSELSIVLADKWRAASEEEKRPHLERELRERGVYHSQMSLWREGEKEKEQERVREKAASAIGSAEACDRAFSGQGDAIVEDLASQSDAAVLVAHSCSSDVDGKSPYPPPVETLEELELSDWDVDNLHHHLVDYVSFMDSEFEMRDDKLPLPSSKGDEAEESAPAGGSSAAESKDADEKSVTRSLKCDSDTYQYIHSFESFLDSSSSYYAAAQPAAASVEMRSQQAEELDAEPCFSLSELFSPDYVPFSSMLLDSKNSTAKGSDQNTGKSNSTSGGKDGVAAAVAPVDKPKRKYTFINRNRRKTSKVEAPKDGNPQPQPAAPSSSSSNNNNNNNAAEMFYHKNNLPLAPPLDLLMSLTSGRPSKDASEVKNPTGSAPSHAMSVSSDTSARVNEAGNQKPDLHWLEQVRSTQQMLDQKKKREQEKQRTLLSDKSANPSLALSRGDQAAQDICSNSAHTGRELGRNPNQIGQGPGPADFLSNRFSVAQPPQPPTYRLPADDPGHSKQSDEDYFDSLFSSNQNHDGLGMAKEHHFYEGVHQNSSSISYPPLVLHDKNSVYAQFDFDSFLLPSQDFDRGEQYRSSGGAGAGGGVAGSVPKDSHSNSSGSTTPATGVSDIKPPHPAAPAAPPAAFHRSTFPTDLQDFAPGSTPASFFDEKAEQQQLLSHLLIQEQEEHKQLQQKIAQRSNSKVAKSRYAHRKEKEQQAKQHKVLGSDPAAAASISGRPGGYYLNQSTQQQQPQLQQQWGQQPQQLSMQQPVDYRLLTHQQHQQQQQQQYLPEPQQNQVHLHNQQPAHLPQNSITNPFGHTVGWQYNPPTGNEIKAAPHHHQPAPPPAPAALAALSNKDVTTSEGAPAAAMPLSLSSSSSQPLRKKNRSTKVTESLRDKSSLQTLQGFGSGTADYDDLVYGSARDH